ncbi:DUF2264 domain-containing protein [Niallia alba]|uniref:DUF2264 domain-containing protein n=1 Tax=Niallia alba TaxID=2729105 RepID=UPI002E1CC833|nr:DUF2264 domain-containing protein [Niallia alba]
MLFNTQLKSNPLLTKKDFEKALIDLIDPVYRLMDVQKTPGRFHISDSGSVYGETRRDIEGFLRTLWGLGPLGTSTSKINKYKKYFDAANKGIMEGTNPASKFYWGHLHNYDQLFVEMGALSCYLLLTKESFWDQWNSSQQKNIFQWMNQINHHTIPNTNWLFFRILVNTFFEEANLAINNEQIEQDLTELDSYYLDDGWYFDGYDNQIDYYIPFAMHYYGLLFSTFYKRKSVSISKFKERGKIFGKSFKNWFVKDGTALPFGRSLTYRFAQSSYWAAAIYSDINIEDVSLSEAKYLLTNNMREWFQKPIFTAEGFLSIGYYYPNLVMAEGYNAPGSPYWALKNFIILALPDNHDFWKEPEIQPKFSKKVQNPYSRMLLVHNEDGSELQAFTAGQHSHEHAHGEAKYEKFVYSTTFGFSVAKGYVLPKQGAFDNTLALSESEFHFRSPFGYEEYTVEEEFVYSLWKPWDDVTVKSFIIPVSPWHVRVHIIQSNRPLHIFEGGFSCPDDGTQVITKQENSIFYQSSIGISGLISMESNLEATLIYPEPNTNIFYPKTVLPALRGKLAPGKHILNSVYLGSNKTIEIPSDYKIEWNNNSLQITIGEISKNVTLTPL